MPERCSRYAGPKRLLGREVACLLLGYPIESAEKRFVRHVSYTIVNMSDALSVPGDTKDETPRSAGSNHNRVTTNPANLPNATRSSTTSPCTNDT